MKFINPSSFPVKIAKNRKLRQTEILRRLHSVTKNVVLHIFIRVQETRLIDLLLGNDNANNLGTCYLDNQI